MPPPDGHWLLPPGQEIEQVAGQLKEGAWPKHVPGRLPLLGSLQKLAHALSQPREPARSRPRDGAQPRAFSQLGSLWKMREGGEDGGCPIGPCSTPGTRRGEMGGIQSLHILHGLKLLAVPDQMTCWGKQSPILKRQQIYFTTQT